MAETAFQYSADVVAVAAKAKVHPFDVEPCVWCGAVAAVLHLDCEKRPFHLIRGSFSPADTVDCSPPKGDWSRKAAWSRRKPTPDGWRIVLVTRHGRELRSRWARKGALTTRYHRKELTQQEYTQRLLDLKQEPMRWPAKWDLRNVWVRVVDKALGPNVVSNITNEHGGETPWFDVHAWGPLRWGEDPNVVQPDLVEFSCELHPVEKSVAEKLRDAAAGRGP